MALGLSKVSRCQKDPHQRCNLPLRDLPQQGLQPRKGSQVQTEDYFDESNASEDNTGDDTGASELEASEYDDFDEDEASYDEDEKEIAV